MSEDLMTPDIDIQHQAASTFKYKFKMDWSEEEKPDIEFLKNSIHQKVGRDLVQAIALEQEFLHKVRTIGLDGQFMKNPDGSYIEDWSRVEIKDMENFIQAGSAWLFFFSTKLNDAYADAVLAKYAYDAAYDFEFSAMLSGTIDDKKAKAARRVQDDRWLAIYKTLYHTEVKSTLDRLEAHIRRVEGIYRQRCKQLDQEWAASRGGRV